MTFFARVQEQAISAGAGAWSALGSLYTASKPLAAHAVTYLKENIPIAAEKVAQFAQTVWANLPAALETTSSWSLAHKELLMVAGATLVLILALSKLSQLLRR